MVFGLLLGLALIVYFYAGYLVGKEAGYQRYTSDWYKTLYKEALKEIEKLKGVDTQE